MKQRPPPHPRDKDWPQRIPPTLGPFPKGRRAEQQASICKPRRPTSEMENEEAFEAEAEIHGLEQMRSRSLHRSTQKGHDTLKATSGGFEPERDIHNEESPLLSPDRGDGGREASERGAGETREPPKWDGEGGFEGRPWWNKPSVRVYHLGTND